MNAIWPNSTCVDHLAAVTSTVLLQVSCAGEWNWPLVLVDDLDLALLLVGLVGEYFVVSGCRHPIPKGDNRLAMVDAEHGTLGSRGVAASVPCSTRLQVLSVGWSMAGAPPKAFHC